MKRASSLVRWLTTAIETGVLAPGARLPSWIDLATQLGVGRGTVKAAYDKLMAAQLIIAARAAGIPNSSSLRYPSTVRRAARPSESFPTGRVGAFVLVTRFLGRHAVPLPEEQTVTPKETCLSALRSILYACESGDNDLAKAGWRTLGRAETGVAVRSLADVQRALSDRHTLEDKKAYPRYLLSDRFTDECLTLSRAYLDMGAAAIFESEVTERGLGAGYALECIVRHGDRTDITRVRALTRAGSYAQTALAALRTLDAS